MKKIKVELCMGSSCFARGNSEILTSLENYIEENNFEEIIELEGHLCMGLCNSGPHIRLNGKDYSELSPDHVIELISNLINEE